MNFTLPEGYKLHSFETVSSTNDVAKKMAADGAGAGTVIISAQQEDGRGRQGREWISPKGNLYMSCVLKPKILARDAGQLSFIVAVALANVIDPFLPNTAELKLKWPNDLLLRDRKVAGILLEADTQSSGEVNWVVLGLGVNVMIAPPDSISINEITLSQSELEISDIAHNFCVELDRLLKQWQEKGFGPVRQAWLDRAAGLQEAIRVRLPNETFFGVFHGLSDDGSLQLLLENGDMKLITSGQVFIG